MEERLIVLIAELDAQWHQIEKLYLSIVEKNKLLQKEMNNEDLTNSLAFKLHNLYSAYEDMFKLIVDFFENQIEHFSRYHTDLLKRMLIDIDGIRPKLLSEKSFTLLDELRGFRHVFRHAYSYVLEAERVIKLAEKSEILKEVFLKDFNDFKNNLRPFA
ncbi:MAG TPA: hypothetical protein QF571_11400 [Desulfobacterales bacterium]|jgi:hypothetical protein|nr:hypothetical protein [Desulfobacterales bacterium]|tara:strand:+ start:122 stop:598 length:477 start_codon:yes stop_codon:yes gene_type:complete